jgi:hypothetical protein
MLTEWPPPLAALNTWLFRTGNEDEGADARGDGDEKIGPEDNMCLKPEGLGFCSR